MRAVDGHLLERLDQFAGAMQVGDQLPCCIPRGLDEFVELGAAYEAAGRAVAFVTGSRLNFKLTTPADLALAEALLAAGPERIP